jgi:hypothetical protein
VSGSDVNFVDMPDTEDAASLVGRHRFSRYTLTFTLVARPGATMLSAHSHADFPGLHGRIYRAPVIGSGLHRVFVTRLLRTVRSRAESLGQ